MRIDITLEIIRHQVVIPVVHDGVDQRRELSRVTKHALADSVEDALQRGVELEVAVEMLVAQVLDVFGEVAKEEDVFFAGFAGDLAKIKVSAIHILYVGEKLQIVPQCWHHRTSQ